MAGDTIPNSAFCRRELGICEGPHAAGDGSAVAWEIGWLNECQAWLQIVAGVQNKAGEMIQARIAELTGEGQASADSRI